MFLHIGEGFLVRKRDIIMILDARKMMAAENSQLFFEAFPGGYHPQHHAVKSIVLVDALVENKRRKASGRSGRMKKNQGKTPMVLVSTIATTTLQRRFHGHLKDMMVTESGEMYEKPTE